MSKTILSSRKIVETFSDPVAAINQLNLHRKIRDFSVPDLEVNFNNGGIEFLRGSGVVNFKRDSEATYLDTDGIIKNVMPDEARVEQNGILLEGPSLNYVKYSETFGFNIKTRCSISSSPTSVLAPNDVTPSYKFQDNAENNTHYITFNSNSNFPIQSLGTNSSYAAKKWLCFSIFVKAAERNEVYIEYLDSSNNSRSLATFNLLEGTFKQLTNNLDYNVVCPYFQNDGNIGGLHIRKDDPASVIKMTKFGKSGIGETNDQAWWRVSLAFYTGMDNNQPVIRFGTVKNGVVAYSGSSAGTEGVYIWGAQLEPLCFPSSYIYSAQTISPSMRQGDRLWISRGAENVPFPHHGSTTYIVDFDLLTQFVHGAPANSNGWKIAAAAEAHNYPYLNALICRDLFDLNGFSYNLARVTSWSSLQVYYDSRSNDILYDEVPTNINGDYSNIQRMSVVYDDLTNYCYLNGALVSTDTDNSSTFVGVPTHIDLGSGWSDVLASDPYADNETKARNSEFLFGHINSFRIFRRALTPYELVMV